MFSPVSLEAQKLITVSIGKINASRVTRTGTSLHRSLLVASVLHKARNIYLEEERERAARFPQCPSSPEVTVTPITNPIVSVSNSDKENSSLQCHEDEVATPDNGEENRLPLNEATTDSSNNLTTSGTTTTTTTVTAVTNNSTTTPSNNSSSSLQPRKRRRVSDQETAAAISSILPKRLRSELREDVSSTYIENTTTINITSSLPTDEVPVTDSPQLFERLSGPEIQEEPRVPTPDDSEESSPDPASPVSPTSSSSSSDESDSDGDDSATDTSTSSCEGEMEVDQLTSLVSYFSFSKSQQNCISSLRSPNGPHVVALTA